MNSKPFRTLVSTVLLAALVLADGGRAWSQSAPRAPRTTLHANVSSVPQIPLTGSIGPNGPFPLFGFLTQEIVGNASLTLGTPSLYAVTVMRVTSDGTSTKVNQVVAPLVAGMFFLVTNATTEGYAITFGGSSGTVVTIAPAAQTLCVSFDGANYVAIGASTGSAWTADVIPSASPYTATAAQPFVAVNTATGAVEVITVAKPVDGQELTVKPTAASATPITVLANTGSTVELYNAPGTFGASTLIPGQGGGVRFKYRALDTKWISYAGYPSP